MNSPFTPIFKCPLRCGATTVVSEVHGGTPTTPAWTEEQGVHDGAGHELDDAWRACLWPTGAARARHFPGGRTAAIGRSRGH